MNQSRGDFQPRVWVLMSPRAGDNTQLVALAEALGLPFELKRMAYRRAEWLARIPLGATLIGVDRTRSTSLEAPYPDIIFAAGRATEGVAFWIRGHLNPAVRLVYLGTPWARLDRFDLVITTPQYRLPVRSNVLHNALPLHGISPERLATAAQQWAPQLASLPEPRIAVLVGGRSGPYVFGPDSAARLAHEASDRARSLGGSLLITTSPRTSEAAAEALFKGLTVPAYCHRWQAGEAANPLHAYLALASEIIVTADSISMITEACATGKPTYLFDIETGTRTMRDCRTSGQPYLHWKGADFTSTLWRLGLLFGPDWWTRDIRIVHRALVASGRVAWLGEGTPQSTADSARQDMDRAIMEIKNLLRIT